MTTQAPPSAGFLRFQKLTLKIQPFSSWRRCSLKFSVENLFRETGKGLTNCLYGLSTPRFFVKNKKSVPSGVLKMQSLACIFALRAGLVGARNLPLRFDSTHLAGAVRANPHQLRWRGLARSSCELVRVNSFLPPSLSSSSFFDHNRGSRGNAWPLPQRGVTEPTARSGWGTKSISFSKISVMVRSWTGHLYHHVKQRHALNAVDQASCALSHRVIFPQFGTIRTHGRSTLTIWTSGPSREPDHHRTLTGPCTWTSPDRTGPPIQIWWKCR